MSDAELEHVCKAQFSGYAPWVYWTSEVYSLGKCFRKWTKFPLILPLFVHADHGVGLLSNLFQIDIESRAKVFFTWNPVKEKRHKDLSGKMVLRIVHPWINYRWSRGIKRSSSPKGTMVFFSHSTPFTKYEGHDTDGYLETLRELPEKFQPVVICLHMHDVNAGLHKKLRPYGFLIVTAGNVNATNFVDRFYGLVTTFAYATSPGWGSQVAYCVELGVPYFFLGEQPELINIADKNLPTGIAPKYWDKFHEQYSKTAEALFRVPVDKVTEEQRAFIESLLGMDSKITAEQVSRILWREFLRNFWKPHIILRPVLILFIHKFGLYPMIKRIQEKFNSKQ